MGPVHGPTEKRPAFKLMHYRPVLVQIRVTPLAASLSMGSVQHRRLLEIAGLLDSQLTPTRRLSV